jgi:hypothetical protein
MNSSTPSLADRVKRNIARAAEISARGDGPALFGVVCGTSAARTYWTRRLSESARTLGASRTLAIVEDLPTNQALGLLLLWDRLRGESLADGALFAFVFGTGSRAAPFTQAECGQKSAISTFVQSRSGSARSWVSVVELALRCFAPVEEFLRRNGFRGLVVKWGDEIQIPALDLSGTDRRFAGVDIVRFVTRRTMTAAEARSKDWLSVDKRGRITAFAGRRPIERMAELAARGVFELDDGNIVGHVNLGSIAVSAELLDALLLEFRSEIYDPSADRSRRPTLDPQFFTALTIAATPGRDERRRRWIEACRESAAIAAVDQEFPGLVDRLRGVIESLERARGREFEMVALDFEDQYWGDVGELPRIRSFLGAINETGDEGEIARALAGLEARRDERGNIIAGATRLAADVDVRDSVLIDVEIGQRGQIRRSVLLGTRAREIVAEGAIDVSSTVERIQLAPGSVTYRVISFEPVQSIRDEHLTTVFLESDVVLLRGGPAHEISMSGSAYDRRIPGNPLSFREAQAVVSALDPDEVEERRQRLAAVVEQGWAAETRGEPG